MERDVLGADGAVDRVRAKALGGAGRLAMFQGDYEAAKPLLEEGLALYRQVGDKNGIASCLAFLGFVAVLSQRDLESLPALFEEAMGLKPEVTDTRTIANLLILAGLISASKGDLERAVTLPGEALALYREIRDVQGISMCLTNMGVVEMARGNHLRAATLIRENLLLARGADDKLSLHYSLVGLAGVALGLGDPARAARLWGMAQAMREAFGIHLTPLARSHIRYESLLAAARTQLGDESFERTWDEGKALKGEEALEHALAEEEPTPTLTRREEEIALLVARGLTNRRIAEELAISERTVSTHVGRISKKLGLRSRDEVAPALERRPHATE